MTKQQRETLLRYAPAGEPVRYKVMGGGNEDQAVSIQWKAFAELLAEIGQAAAHADKTEKKRLRDLLNKLDELFDVVADAIPTDPT